MRLILRPVDSKGNILSGQNSGSWDEFIKIENLNNILFLKAQIADKNLRFCFDTGAETNVLNNSLNKSVLQTVSITRTVKLMGAGKSASEVIYGIMNNFKIGERELKNMQTIISYTDHLSDAFGTQVDGVLGFDFITRANFCINFEKGTMGIFYLNRE
ncbi:MAG: retropepsin-like domain-containing protein [Bacteroidales bacterium]|nr:retropepsin-like domain-containing protein [Bacteroidales bacterium]